MFHVHLIMLANLFLLEHNVVLLPSSVSRLDWFGVHYGRFYLQTLELSVSLYLSPRSRSLLTRALTADYDASPPICIPSTNM